MADEVTGPETLTALLRSLDWLTAPDPAQDPEDTSATTLSLCAIDRVRGEVEGWSTGDSAVFHLSAERVKQAETDAKIVDRARSVLAKPSMEQLVATSARSP